MAYLMDRQNLAVVVIVFAVIALVKLVVVLTSLIKYRWKLLALTKGMETGGLREPPHILFGNLNEVPRDEEDRVDRLLEVSNRCVNLRRFWFGPFTCIIMILNPEYIKVVSANVDSKDNMMYDVVKPWLGDGLLISKGDKWMRHRRLLTPAFHFEILRPYVKIYVDSTKVFLENLSATKGAFIDVWSNVSLLTLDTLLKCSFSYESNCQADKKNQYIESVYEMAELILKRVLFPLYQVDFIYRWSPQGRRFHKLVKTVHDKADAAIKQRRQELVRKNRNENTEEGTTRKRKYMDFLDVLLEARDEHGNCMDDLEIRDEVDTFMFEGHDTTASGISWCLYNMARFPEFQQKCRDEVNELLQRKNKDELEWDDLSRLSFLTMFIKESLRFHPPVPQVGRTLVKDVTLPNGLLLPKGTVVATMSIATHHHKLYWNDPEVFDPYRFSPENNAKRHSHAFIPFSAGPRNCIGQNFAMNEMKVVTAMTIRRFQISCDPKRPPKWIQRLVLRSKNGIHLQFIPAISKHQNKTNISASSLKLLFSIPTNMTKEITNSKMLKIQTLS